MSSLLPDLPRAQPDPKRDGGQRDLQGIANLAFGSLSGYDESSRSHHLALLHSESLELDLDDPAQRQFGDYELQERIGEGGMGVVYRARHLPLDREVAVKLLSAGPWASKDFIARFEREAQNAARMQHPNIVTVFEVGSVEGLQFFSMQLIRGESLSARLRRGEHLVPKAAAGLMRTVAEAVNYAHSLGVLHLDLKPANLLLDETGTPYVADFGLARRLENALAIDNDEVSGTPSYMAPEQALVRANKLTAATDIWGMGAILYELLTGRPPFRADTAQDTVKLVQEGQVRAPRRWEPELPLDLEAIVLRCLNRDPAERYPSARALADDLARYVEGRPVQARPLNGVQRLARWAKREPTLAATALLAFGLLAGGLAATTTQWRRADANAGTARDNLWATRAQTAQQALVKGDGFHSLRPLVANLKEMETAGRADDRNIERDRVGTILANAPQLVDLVHLPPGEHGTSLAISPDGRRFAVATIERNGGAARRIREYDLVTLREVWTTSTEHRSFLSGGGDFGAQLGSLRYTADGRFLLVSTADQPVTPAPRTSDMIALDARDGRVVWPTGLPKRQDDIVYDDAVRLALVRYRSDKSLRWPDSAQFYQVDGWKSVGPLHTVATTLAADFWLPAPDGSAWLGTADSARIALYDVPSLKPRWHLELPQTSLVRSWQFSHDGRHIALGSVDGAVRLVDAADGHGVKLGTGPAGRVQWVQFSPDDRTLAALDENGQLWTWDVATGASRSAPLHLLRNGVAGGRIRYAADTLFVGGMPGGDGELAYVTLAPRAVFFNEVVPGAVHLPGLYGGGAAFDLSLVADRLITASSSDLIEVWRLPASPLLKARAAPLPSDTLAFDGHRVVAVDGDTVQVVDVATGAVLSPPLHHPEPVRFAELAPDDSALVTIAGRTVRVIDPRTWQLRGTPILLPATPERAVFAQAAPWLVLTTRAYRGDLLRTRLYRIDLAHGTLHQGAEVDGLTDLAIDAQGRYAIVGTANNVTDATASPLVVALDGGAVKCAPKIGPSWYAALAADGRSAWFIVPGGIGWLPQRWDLDACRKVAQAGPPGLTGSAVPRAQGGGLVVHKGGREALIEFGPDGRRKAAIGEVVPAAMSDFALSTDGNRAAFATRNALYLIDAHHGRRLSAPLTAPIAGDDAIAKLAFSPDGKRLLARTINGRWLFWSLPRSESTVAELTRLARVLDPDQADALSKGELDALRAQLHTVPLDRPVATRTTNRAVRDFASAAGAGVDPRFVVLDLRPAVTVPLVGSAWSEPFERADRPTLAPGLQRFLGVDYRIDGGVQLSGGRTATALGPELHHSAVVPVPDVIARRVHVLVMMHIPMSHKDPSRPFVDVVLVGSDRRETRLEVRTVRDVVTDSLPWLAASGARIAFASADSAQVRETASAYPSSNVYTVDLEVPPGTGAIHGLRFDVPDGPMEAPLVFAATLEVASPAALAKQP